MMSRLSAIALFAVLAVPCLPAFGQEHGSKDEAVAMVQAAVAHVQKVGPEKAFKDFTEDKTTWTKKDLYVMAYNYDGTCVGHGANPKLVGKNLNSLRDASGKHLIKEFTEVSKSKGSGWVDYEWAHPQTKKVEAKSTFASRLPNYDGWVGVGIYR